MLPRSDANRRRSERASVLLDASVVTLNAYQYFELINLSASGAKLRGASVPSAGKTGMFRLQAYQAMCKVVWSKGELCGVQFDELMPPRTFDHFREAGRITGAEMLTSDEQQAEEEWMNGAGD